jgi:hypothetical protein
MVQTTKTQPSDTLRGVALLDDPIRNKGTAFTSEERRQYGLEGLLPHSVENLDRQVERVMEHLDAKPNDLERYIYLIGLSDRNETLFYRAVMSDPARFIPILYDPTVADACLAFGHIYRRARGMYITREMKGRIAGAPKCKLLIVGEFWQGDDGESIHSTKWLKLLRGKPGDVLKWIGANRATMLPSARDEAKS